jgi:hypothetical protein
MPEKENTGNHDQKKKNQLQNDFSVHQPSFFVFIDMNSVETITKKGFNEADKRQAKKWGTIWYFVPLCEMI